LTHDRYYVILFGIFAAASGVVLSIIPVRKNGIVAAMLIAFAMISIIPPADAFTMSRASQTGRLERVLLKNNMLVDGSVVPNGAISAEDKKTIAQAFGYLRMMEYTGRLEWLPEDYDDYNGFYRLFGFNEYELPGDSYENVYLVLEQQKPVDIKGYDTFVNFGINMNGSKATEKICDITEENMKYTLNKYTAEGQGEIFLTAEGGQELIRFSAKEIFDRFSGYNSGKGSINLEEATFLKENGSVKLKLIVLNATINKSPDSVFYNAELYALITIK
jgi:hypothetical protein